MSRKRSISTDLSTDPRLEELAEGGPLPCLLYTWAIPHADDWGRMTGDARQFRLLVCPALALTAAQVDEVIDQIARVGLWQRYEIEGKHYISFPRESWFKHQSYISQDKRNRDKSHFPPPPDGDQRTTPQNATNPQGSANNTAKRHKVVPSVPSPSPSPSLLTETSQKGEEEGSPALSIVPNLRDKAVVVLSLFGYDGTESEIAQAVRKMEKHPSLDPIEEAIDCKDYFTRKGKKVRSWLATWGNWMKNSESDPPWRRESQESAPPQPASTWTEEDDLFLFQKYIPLHSDVPEWDAILQALQDYGKIKCGVATRLLVPLQARPPKDGVLELMAPPDVLRRRSLFDSSLDYHITKALRQIGLDSYRLVAAA